jgi:hypothetical protein
MYRPIYTPELRTIKLELSSDLILEVSGMYVKSEAMTDDYPGCSDEIEISHIEITKGDNLDLVYWCSDMGKDCITVLEDLCIESIRKDDF